ncbi:MAG: acyloxyacyl hydrolase [Bacteroidales bacterium]
MIRIIILLTIISLLFPASLPAQEKNIPDIPRHRLGFIVGYGDKYELVLKANYEYKVVLFQIQYGYALLKKEKWGIDMVLQPQYNVTKYKYESSDQDYRNGFEYGINLGVLLRMNCCRDLLSFYTIISAGPHYTKGSIKRQAPGFIFSDNLSLGSNIKLWEDIYLDVRTGFRHLSNANLNQPNIGIDNIILSGGFHYNL